MKKFFAAALAAVLVLAMSAGALAAGKVTMEQAKAAALSRAGAAESEVRFTKAHPDMDDGRSTYEFEFWKGNTEYDVEVDANTGRVRDFDAENHMSRYDDDGDFDFDDLLD